MAINGSMQDGDGTIGHRLTMLIAKGYLFVRVRAILVLDPKASEQEEKEKSSLIDQCLRLSIHECMLCLYCPP